MALQRARLTATAMLMLFEVACTACYHKMVCLKYLNVLRGFPVGLALFLEGPTLFFTQTKFIIGMVGCGSSDDTASCNMLSWLIPMQAKQEEVQQKAQEDAKKRQEAIRKREEEAAQRRYVTVCQQVLHSPPAPSLLLKMQCSSTLFQMQSSDTGAVLCSDLAVWL